MEARLIDRCQALALEAPGVGRNKNYRLAAFLIDEKGHVVRKGVNLYKTHPGLLPFFKFPHLHAEANVLLHQGLGNCEGHELLVIRVGAKGERTMAKPCSSCMKMMQYANIHKVYYSDWKGDICERYVDY